MRWDFHTCGRLSFDPVCRQWGSNRIHITTPWGHLTVALTRNSRMAEGGRGSWIRVGRHGRPY